MELNKKLAEWAGIDTEYTPPSSALCCYEGYKAKNTDGQREWLSKLPNFTEDLTACFKWLVPKLVRWDMGSLSTGEFYFTACQKGQTYPSSGQAETPALALCKAIEKLIDDKKPPLSPSIKWAGE